MTALNIAQAKRAFLLLQIKSLLERIEASGPEQLDAAKDACRNAVRDQQTKCCRNVCTYCKDHVDFIATTAKIDRFVVREVYLSNDLDIMAATLKLFCATHSIGRSAR